MVSNTMHTHFFISHHRYTRGSRDATRAGRRQGGLASLDASLAESRQASRSGPRNVRKDALRGGQVMLLSVVLMGGILLTAGAFAGLLLIYQVRQANDSVNSAKALFAADAGIEAGSYQYTKLGEFGDVTVPPLTNGASASGTVVYDQTTQIIAVRAQGISEKAVRALEAVFDEGNQGGAGPCVSASGIFAIPTFAENVSRSAVPWVNPLLALASNNQHATTAIGDTGAPSDELRVSQFNFCIPVSATVIGIEVQVEKRALLANRVRDLEMRLLDDQGNRVGAEKADVAFWPLSDDVTFYGGQNDPWGTLLTPQQINSQNFGIVMGAQDVPANLVTNSADVDAVSIAIYYTLN